MCLTIQVGAVTVCDSCLRPDEKKILLEINEVWDKTGAKFEAGVEALTKALGYDSERQQKEISPFRAVRELEDLSKDAVERELLQLYREISRKWLGLEKAKGSDPFVLNGRIFLDPKSGKPLTNKQWGIIKRDILKAFDYIYAQEEERIALHAICLGRVLKGMPLDQALHTSYKKLKPAVDDAMTKLTGPEWQRQLTFARQDAASMVQEVTQRQYKQLHDTIQTAVKNRQNPRELQRELYDKFGSWNRDWRRIAETEINNSQNNGQLVTELDRKGEEEQVFMIGVSNVNACPWCEQHVNNQIVALLSNAPSGGGDKVTINGEEYTAIWPGKSNYGRRRADWWVSAGTQHPHCRCTWSKYVPGFEKYEKMFQDALAGAREEGKRRMKKPDDIEATIKPTPWGR